jgi:bifunctional DNA-binding transcriptional regulator/antitoxin component of YhaV-PrlF toxin-antitoxin module
MRQAKISKAFQIALSTEAIRALGLRPGMRVNQFIEGSRIVIEPVEDADALAGSLGTEKRAPSVKELKTAARRGITKAGVSGVEDKD